MSHLDGCHTKSPDPLDDRCAIDSKGSSEANQCQEDISEPVEDKNSGQEDVSPPIRGDKRSQENICELQNESQSYSCHNKRTKPTGIHSPLEQGHSHSQSMSPSNQSIAPRIQPVRMTKSPEDSSNTTNRWSELPYHILQLILHHVGDWRARCHASLACVRWREAFSSPALWRHFKFCFRGGQEVSDALLRLVEHPQGSGRHVRHFEILVWQEEACQRTAACALLHRLATDTDLCVDGLTLKFCGVNPPFYRDEEFLSALRSVFGARRLLKEVAVKAPLRVDNQLVGLLGQSAGTLTSVDLLSPALVSLISPSVVDYLVRSAPRLNMLKVRLVSISNDVLTSIANQAPRSPSDNQVRRPTQANQVLRPSAGNRLAGAEDIVINADSFFLFLGCSRAEKFVKFPSGESWSLLTQSRPNLKVGFHFDHRCLVLTMRECLEAQARVSHVDMLTYTSLSEEVSLLTGKHAATLESLTVMGQSGPELDRALLGLSRACAQHALLRKVTVYGTIGEEVKGHFRDNHGSRVQLNFYDSTTSDHAAVVVGTAQEAMILEGQNPRARATSGD